MSSLNSPRVNSARLGDYLSRTVRLTGKVLRFTDASNEVVLQASDGGEVRVIMISGSESSMTSSFVEIIGIAQSPNSVKAQACLNLGDDLDLDLVNFVVEKWHDPKFASMF
ncbi:replication factor A protein 3 [Cytidiella melzeri]|nr:replication factor A protein 3 [Cytidiella melzeri]